MDQVQQLLLCLFVMNPKSLTHQDYSVGWVCALTEESASAINMLDERHSDLQNQRNDPNVYNLGSIGPHNIVIACLPMGDIGSNAAATIATRMINTFPFIRLWLNVGIGGGVPPKVRLGDVVVSNPEYNYPGVVQWDKGMLEDKGFRPIGTLDKPPEVLRSALRKLEVEHISRGSDTRILDILDGLRSKNPRFASKYLRSKNLKDVLYQSDYDHVDEDGQAVVENDEKHSVLAKLREEEDEEEEGEEEEEGNQEEDFNPSCPYCDSAMAMKRKPRKTKIKIHYGTIVSGNSVIKNAKNRDAINQRVGGRALCFEMEAAGILNSHPCLVIRGICGKALTISLTVLVLIKPTRLCGYT